MKEEPKPVIAEPVKEESNLIVATSKPAMEEIETPEDSDFKVGE